MDWPQLFSTLFGAAVGGLLALAGSLIVNQRAHRGNALRQLAEINPNEMTRLTDDLRRMTGPYDGIKYPRFRREWLSVEHLALHAVYLAEQARAVKAERERLRADLDNFDGEFQRRWTRAVDLYNARGAVRAEDEAIDLVRWQGRIATFHARYYELLNAAKAPGYSIEPPAESSEPETD